MSFIIYRWRFGLSVRLGSFRDQADFHYFVDLDNVFSPLEYLATFDLGSDGTFEIMVDLRFPMTTLEDGDDRVMLHLLACDEAARGFLNLPSDASASSSNDSFAPSFCAMANRALDFYCQSFPLENQSPDSLVYQSKKTVAGSGNTSSQSDFARLMGSSTTQLTFYIDACELLGGTDAILRSCLEYPPPPANGHDSTCYYCPENVPGRSKADDERWSKECTISPLIREPVKGTVGMELSSTALWGGWGCVWMWHMHLASTGCAVALHYKLLAIPATQVVYTGLSVAAKYTAGQFAKILGAERHLRIRSVSVEWALAFVILKQLQVSSIGIAVIWGISWASIMFLLHHYSAANLKMLRLRYRIGEQLGIDTTLVMWKGTLFLNFRRLQKGFLFVAIITALTGSDNRWRVWEWISVQGYEILIFLLYSVLGYICRCQEFRFSELENLEIEVDPESNGTTAAQENGSIDAVSGTNVISVVVELPRKKTTALVLNPDRSVLLGTTFVLKKSDSA
ncbi:hypothetical protein GN244_ATG04159 [Phytophthora infestans]|uniref:Transmembrane protein n=1 Tax=Phytophthora infestans TaxID=4787 RepID=A0A833WJ91_PHYIN|nr:hypothetical protein GN244_ATG04159 [Phytophthora infestans]